MRGGANGQLTSGAVGQLYRNLIGHGYFSLNLSASQWPLDDEIGLAQAYVAPSPEKTALTERLPVQPCRGA
ncbi:hypothetical protein ATTO_11820 [Leptogranulimonas caecicola]|uniref:Uncharacterized protein n=1 Tax=Leptogranulimonas caecicola TaxID=2894156 RepID=A0AAU9D2F8_9ACTN|nr:hypothetical protein ATTO_11820 [Leptogranulimonas caecicola]